MKVFSLLMLFGTAATAAVVEGTVINAFTRAALDGANVQLTHTGATPQKSEYRAKTDSRGAFRIDGVAAGDYVLVLEKAAFLPLANEHVAARPFRVSDVSDVIRLNAELQQMPRLSGRVTDSENRPLAGIGVELGRASGGGVNLTRTD